MKDKIMFLVIGILLGAVISTGAFYVYTTSNSTKCSNQTSQMGNGTPPEMPSGQSGQTGQPPEKPSGDTAQSNSTQNSN